jgi:hypothetical protein
VMVLGKDELLRSARSGRSCRGGGISGFGHGGASLAPLRDQAARSSSVTSTSGLYLVIVSRS